MACPRSDFLILTARAMLAKPLSIVSAILLFGLSVATILRINLAQMARALAALRSVQHAETARKSRAAARAIVDVLNRSSGRGALGAEALIL